MIDLYTWPTPNGRKISIALEEFALEYEVHAVNIGKDEQFAPEFLAISPNNKIPAIVDRASGRSMMESGAILIYLAEKYAALMPQDLANRSACISWLFWQESSTSYLGGGFGHFYKYAPYPMEYPIDRYAMETKR